MPSLVVPTSIGGAVIDAARHPWQTADRHFTDGNFHTVRKITDLAKDVFETTHLVLADCAPDFSAAIHAFKTVGDVSKTLYVFDVSWKAWKGKEITRYDHLQDIHMQWVKAVATAIMNISQGILFISKYVLIKPYAAATNEIISVTTWVSYSIGGGTGLWIAETVTSISVGTINKLSASIFLGIESYQFYTEFVEDRQRMSAAKIVSTKLKSLEFLGKAAVCTLLIFNVATPVVVGVSLLTNIVVVVSHNQKLALDIDKGHKTTQGLGKLDRLVQAAKNGTPLAPPSQRDERSMRGAIAESRKAAAKLNR